MDLLFSRILYASPLLLRLVAAQTATAAQQLFNLPAFSQQQLCLQGCFTEDNFCVTDLVGSAIGCPYSPCTVTNDQYGAADNCYCRGDLQGAAQSFISACVQSACTVGDTSVNIATAVSIYAGYCTSLGFTAYAANTNEADATSLNTDLGTSGTTNRAGSTGSNTGSLSSETSTSTDTSPPKTTLYIALAIVGGVAALLFISSATWASKYRKMKQQRRTEWPKNSTYGPYSQSMHPMSSHTSNHPLRYDHEVFPNDSASNVGVPVPPAYPHPMEPSLVSTRMY